MAELKVFVERIHEIKEHPNADRMELAIIGSEGGYQCCVQKGVFKDGDLCVYFPVDSILPGPLQDKIFGNDAKVKLSKNRVKTIRLRGAVSQGMAIPTNIVSIPVEYGTDLTDVLGVTKYEPPQKNFISGQGQKGGTDRNPNKDFHKYTDINHLRQYPDALDGKKVVVYEKVHGTNFRAGWCKSPPKTLWNKIKNFFGKYEGYEFVYGSHNVQLQGRYKDTDFYSKKVGMDIYSDCVRKYKLKEILTYGEVIYGEIYGGGVQDNYWYGLKKDEQKMVVIDVKIDGLFLDDYAYTAFCQYRFPMPPLVYYGVFDRKYIDKVMSMGSFLCNDQKIMEGVVIRPLEEEVGYMGRMIFKHLNPEYLLQKGNTENH